MKIVFRLSYRTEPGQSFGIKLAMILEGTEVRFEQELEMRTLDQECWEAEIDVRSNVPLRLEYGYQLRQDWNGVKLDEWDGPRIARTDETMHDTLLLLDHWCSAGAADYAYETKAFQAFLTPRDTFVTPNIAAGANHLFQIHVAAVPDGLVPCVIGSVREIGDWGWHHAVPLELVAANIWQAAVYLPTDWRIEYKYGLFNPKLGCAVSLEAGENRVLPARVISERQMTWVRDENFRRESAALYRAAGVAIPVFSLRSDQSLGVGEFADLKLLADWAAGVGLKLIQILPINDTTSAHDWTDSYPYSAISAFALHPLYLRIEDMGYAMPAEFAVDLDSSRELLNVLAHVDYEEVMKAKTLLARQVFAKHRKAIIASNGFKEFLAQNRDWLLPYAAFCVKRDQFGTADFSQWADWAVFDRTKVDAMTQAKHPDWAEISYHIWLQYELDRQLTDAVKHLHTRGIALKGDLPIGIDRQSADAWSAPHLFQMDAQTGAPPDAFATKGQNWGFPTYNWQAMRADGYAWWRSRFAQLSRYFDAYRIDHILGFFRIWQVPYDQVEGIMGWFDPARPLAVEEIRDCGIPFDFDRFCRPFIREEFLWDLFGDDLPEVRHQYLQEIGNGSYRLRDHVATQRLIVDHFATWDLQDPAVRGKAERIKESLLDCASDVLFFEVPGSQGTRFHPRCLLQKTRSFMALDADSQRRLDALYVDYFYHRQEALWQAEGYAKLPIMRRASPMLLCGEDLGMVPACVPGVMQELGILSLEIQRMPKIPGVQFADPAQAPYMSVVSPSTHDMPTLRGWWREDSITTSQFAWRILGNAFPKNDLSGEIAAMILQQHFHSPAMWAVVPLQDLLAIDEGLRNPDIDGERINVPAIMPYYWRYRMHLSLEELAAADDWNTKLAGMLLASSRTEAIMNDFIKRMP